MPEPEPYEPVGLTGNAPSDLQAETARLARALAAREAERDLGRTGARGSRAALGADDGHRRPVGAHRRRQDRPRSAEVVAQGRTAAERFLLQWRGEADPKAVSAIDTYWICTAEHGLNASTFTARVVASTGADCGAALSSAVGALSGPLHGGAPAYVKPMLDEVAATGDPEKWVKDTLDSGKRVMGFGHRIYRAEDPRSRILKETARELGSPADRGRRAPRGGRPRRARAAPSRAAAEDERRVLLRDRPRRRPGPAAARARHVRVLSRRRLVGPHPRAEADGPPLPAERPVRRPCLARTVALRVTLAEAAAQAAALAEAGKERELSELRREWGDELEGARAVERLPRAGDRLPRDRAVPLAPEDRAAPARARGRQSRLPRARRSSRSTFSRATTRASSTRSACCS